MDSRPAPSRQHPAVLPAVIALGALAACAPARPAASAHSTARADDRTRRALACAAPGLPAPDWSDVPEQTVPEGWTATRVVIRGNGAVPARLVRAAIRQKAGEPIDPDVVAADIRRIWRLEAFSDVRVEFEAEGGGTALVYALEPRRLLGRVFYGGDGAVRVGVHAGDLYDPARIQRRVGSLVSAARAAGYLEARGAVHARLPDESTVDLCVAVYRGPRFFIDRIVFDGNHRVDDATLRAALHTADGKVERPGRPYRADLLQTDRLFLSASYFDRGMLSVRIHAPRAVLDRARHRVTVHFQVDEGPVFRLGKLAVRGRLLTSAATYRKLLGVRSGEVFDRSRFLAGLERIRDYHLWRGHGSLAVEPDSHLDLARHTVDLVLKVEKAK